MIDLMLLAAVQPTVPDTYRWSWTGSAILIGICLFVLFVASRTIRYPQAGPKMPLPFPSLFNNPSVGTFLGAMSFGHLLGIAAILGLNNIGVLK